MCGALIVVVKLYWVLPHGTWYYLTYRVPTRHITGPNSVPLFLHHFITQFDHEKKSPIDNKTTRDVGRVKEMRLLAWLGDPK